MEALIGLAAGILYAAACVGAGLLALAALHATPHHDLQARWATLHTLTSAFLLGQGTLASAWLLIGLGGWFERSLVSLACVPLAAWAGVCVLRGFRGRAYAAVRRLTAHWRGLGWETQVAAAVVVVTMALLGVLAVGMPARFGGGDGLFFYLVLPKLMAASGHLVPVPAYERSHSVFGFQGEMHAAAALLLGNERAVLFTAWLALVSLVASTCALAAQLGVRARGAWIAAALVLSSSAVRLVAFNGKTDVFAASLGVEAIVWAVLAHRRGSAATALVCGLLAGFAVAGKATYAASVPLICALLLSFSRPQARRLRRLLAFGLGASVAYAPQAIKNAIWFGDPLAAFTQVSTRPWNDLPAALTIIATLPFALAFGNYLLQLGNVSPLFISYLPLVWTYRRRMRATPGLALTSVVVTGVVVANGVATAGFFAPRFMLAALIALSVPVAFAAEAALRNCATHRLLAAATGLAAAGALVLYPGNRLEAASAWRYLVRGADECTFDPANTAPCLALWAANRLVPEGSRVFYQGYSYYLRPDLIECELAGDELGLRTSTRFWEDVFDHGFTYAIRDSQFPFGASPEAAPPWLSLTRIFEAQGQEVWTIRSSDPGRRPLRQCVRAAPRLWRVFAT